MPPVKRSNRTAKKNDKTAPAPAAPKGKAPPPVEEEEESLVEEEPAPKKGKEQPAPKGTAAATTGPKISVVPLKQPPPLSAAYDDTALAAAESAMNSAEKELKAGAPADRAELTKMYLRKKADYEAIVSARALRDEQIAYGGAVRALTNLKYDKEGNFVGFQESVLPESLQTDGSMEYVGTDDKGNALYKPFGWPDKPTEQDLRAWEAKLKGMHADAAKRFPQADIANAGAPPGIPESQWAQFTPEQKRMFWAAQSTSTPEDWNSLARELVGKAAGVGINLLQLYVQGQMQLPGPAAGTPAHALRKLVGGRSRKASKRSGSKSRRTGRR